MATKRGEGSPSVPRHFIGAPQEHRGGGSAPRVPLRVGLPSGKVSPLSEARSFSIAREIIRAPSPAEEGNDGLREKPTWRESGPRPVSGKNTGLDVDCTVP